MSTLKEKLYEKRGYVYQIGKEYYAIGANTFVQITDQAEIDNVELLQNALKKKNERQIAKYFDKLIRIANRYRGDAREYYHLKDKLFHFLDHLEAQDEEAYRNLQNQVVEFDETFARYSKYNEEKENV